MRSISIGLGVLALVINTSCKKCKQCHYTYSKTEIIQTPNGEETKKTEGLIGYVVDDNGLPVKQECVKGGEASTIQTQYETEQSTSSLDDFTVVCKDV